MMLAEAQTGYRFVRKTQLGPNEYRKNFHQIDREVMAVITSPEADQVTPLMSKIYLRLVNAPERFWEREGVLRITAEVRDERLMKASAVLYDLVGVAAATASKAIQWMHEQGIIGYFSGKNGVGLRIFLNRAVSSIGARSTSVGKKFLLFPPGSSGKVLASPNEPAFNDSFAVLEVLDSDLNPHAPKNGADTKPVDQPVRTPTPASEIQSHSPNPAPRREAAAPTSRPVSVDEIVARLKNELEPCVTSAASKAAAHTATREIIRTREWFETKALPKAIRVAQHETYDLLRKHGQVEPRAQRARADLEVGRPPEDHIQTSPRPLTPAEIRETAETCVALLEAQGKSIEVTLSEVSSEAGGWLLPFDVAKVREVVQSMLLNGSEREVETR